MDDVVIFQACPSGESVFKRSGLESPIGEGGWEGGWEVGG